MVHFIGSKNICKGNSKFNIAEIWQKIFYKIWVQFQREYAITKFNDCSNDEAKSYSHLFMAAKYLSANKYKIYGKFNVFKVIKI